MDTYNLGCVLWIMLPTGLRCVGPGGDWRLVLTSNGLGRQFMDLYTVSGELDGTAGSTCTFQMGVLAARAGMTLASCQACNLNHSS